LSAKIEKTIPLNRKQGDSFFLRVCKVIISSEFLYNWLNNISIDHTCPQEGKSMTNKELLFGYFLTPTSDNYPELLKHAKLADQLGLDLIGIQDHPYQRRFFDTWTLLTALAAQTENIRFFPDVANLPLRPPAILAKSAASLDVITGGRVELGLGAGAFWEGIGALGGPVREPGEAVEALEEAIQVVRLMWSGERGVRYEGKHYQLKGAHSGPVPAHPIQLYIGAVGPRMLNLTGRLGDGWIPSTSFVPPKRLAEMNKQIDEGVEEAGRSPGDVRRMYNLFGMIRKEQSGFLEGPVEHWVEEISRLAKEERIDTFIYGPEEASIEQIRLFGEVVEGVRERVEV
jgi:alkanesulfonate monooxygenase SsuD/methylene tetrahydromethanopterin reductase-like flavin-dependent oxidoreductase (luciferase family)